MSSSFIELPIDLIQVSERFIDIINSHPPKDYKFTVTEGLKKLKRFIESNNKKIDLFFPDYFSILNGLVLKENCRLQALHAVCCSYCDPESYNWSDTLDIVSVYWPDWGLPWLIAAFFEIRNNKKKIDVAYEYIAIAHRLVPVGSGQMMKTLDFFRKESQRILDKNERSFYLINANYLLTKHKPDITNIFRLANNARTASNYQMIGKSLNILFKIHGYDPKSWKVSNEFDDLSSAGGLCTLINMYNAKFNPEHDYQFWNEKAIFFFNKSLRVVRTKKKKNTNENFVLIRLCETYANIVHSNIDKFNDNDFVEQLEKIISIINMRIVTNKKTTYTMYRQLLRIYTSEAIFHLDSSTSVAKFETVVKKADSAFNNLMLLTFDDSKRVRFAKDYFNFLIRIGKYDMALEVSSTYNKNDEVTRALPEIAVLNKKHSTRQAIKKLCTLLSNTWEAQSVIGITNLIFYYCMEASLRGALRPQEKKKAKLAIKAKLGLLIKTCSTLISWNQIKLAEKYLQIIEWVESPNLPDNAIHLIARIKINKVNNNEMDVEKALFWLIKMFNSKPILYKNEFIYSSFLDIIKRVPSFKINPEKVWSIVLDRENVGVIDIHNILEWQINSMQLDRWLEHYLYALRKFPDDDLLPTLPSEMFNVNGENSIDIIIDIFKHLIKESYKKDEKYYNTLLYSMELLPGDFYFTNNSAQNLLSLLKDRSHNLFFLIINGLSAGQISSWMNPDICRMRSEQSANWINLCEIIEEPVKWAQWLGTNRGYFEKIIVNKLTEDFSTLKSEILKADYSINEIRKSIEEFLNKYRNTKDRQASTTNEQEQNQSLADIYDYLERETRDFRMTEKNKDYWKKLIEFVKKWLKSDNKINFSKDMPNIWIGLHQKLEKIISARVIDIVWSPLHTLKNSQSISFVDYTINSVIHRTLHYLSWHRWPEYNKFDLRKVIEFCVYRPPFSVIGRYKKNSGNHPVIYPIRPDYPIMLNGDFSMIAEAVNNLIDNSFRFSPDRELGGWVIVETYIKDNSAYIEISDNGETVSEDTLEILNNPIIVGFSNSSSTGYGIRVAKQVVKQHGGSIKFLRSMNNRGLKVELKFHRFFQGETDE